MTGKPPALPAAPGGCDRWPSFRQLAARAAQSLLLSALAVVPGCRRSSFPDYPADYREYAYVSNGGSNTVTVIDLVNVRQDRVITVGANPTGLAASPTRNEIYVVNSSGDSVSVIDAETNRVAATIPVHRRPYFISVDRSGRRGFVANSGSNDVSVIDFDSRRVVASVGVGEGPGEVRISDDSSTTVETNRVAGSVGLIDAKSLRMRSVFAGCPQATDIAVLPDSSKAFVACSGSHQVMVLGLAHGGPAPERDRLLTMLDVGTTPVHLALKPDGGELFVSNFDSDTVSEIATGTNEVGGAYLVGAHPVRGIVNADNSLLWVANFQADTLGVYSIDDGKLINTVHVGGGPDAMAFSAAGHLLLAANAQTGDISVLRTANREPEGRQVFGTLFTMLPAGRQPNAIVVKAFRTHS